ncbi:DUF6817 domain-containing protein [Rhizobium leguminosarum]|uniref:DUF6817 domain-containing protein n=1 Tax=Rhizobium leguminosarum TaxID=384 RepID=UPI0013DB859B|nr:hypothetical protein [Rhizobium leguminosarum]NEI02410.1 hypothetical protein [Rhizobium leguminosarum]
MVASLGIIKAWLSSAKDVPHSRSTLFEHLVATHSILSAWNVSPYVSRAGLIHSVYSTQFFFDGIFTLDQRPQVRTMVGKKAEALAYQFCTLDRHTLWGEVKVSSIPSLLHAKAHSGVGLVRLDRSTIVSLAQLECANEVEQACGDNGSPGHWMSWTLATIQALPGGVPLKLKTLPAITEKDEASAREAYEKYLYSGCVDQSLLIESVSLNPNVPEVYTFLAITALDQRQFELAHKHNRKALELRKAWGCSWDRRIQDKDWADITSQLAAAVAAQNRPAISVSSLRARLLKEVEIQ